MQKTGMWMAGALALTLLLGGLGLAGVWTAGGCAHPPTPRDRSGGPAAPRPTAALASRLSADAPAAGIFGVNEGLSIPAQLVRSRRLDAAAQETELAEDVRYLTQLGARVVRANSHTYPFLSFSAYARDPALALSYSDRYFAALGASGLEAVLVLGPWPGIQTANYTDRYVPDDMAAYADFVRTVVERYDGDGIDDMPGLVRPVLAWELDNEPDLHNSVRPRGARADTPEPHLFETPQEYAQVARATAAAIRAAAPEATILLGGMYNPRSDSGRAYLEAVLAEPGVRAAFDVLSLHCYRDDDSLDALDETLQIAAELAPDRPVWLTEISVSSAERGEAWQAKMVAALYGEALASGVERMLWHTLADPPPRGGGGAGGEGELPFSHHSLYQTQASSWEPAPGRTAKPSGAVYARLSALLADTPRGALHRAAETSEGRLLWVGDGERSGLVYWGQIALPAAAGGWQVEDLVSGQVQMAAVGARVSAPAWIRQTADERE